MRTCHVIALVAAGLMLAAGPVSCTQARDEAPAAAAETSSATATAAKPAAEKPGPMPAENLLPNPSFETAGKGKAQNQPLGWRQDRWDGKGEWHWAQVGRTGSRSVMIVSTEGADISWTANVPVDPFARYRLSAFIKTENVQTQKGARGALLNLHAVQGVATPAVTGTKDWTRVEVEFDSGDLDGIQVNCLFGGWGFATGKAWFDDVRLEKIAQKPVPPPRVTIDAAATGEPINPFVYGQFIEHLGRCIYGGIWAEMLEDRKFYYPVTANYDPYGGGRRPTDEAPFPVLVASPWEIVGPADAVTMVKEDALAGEQDVRLAPEGVIRQHCLGLVEGKTYNGYIWLKAEGPARVDVSLLISNDQEGVLHARPTPGAYERHAFSFTSDGTLPGTSRVGASLQIRVTGAPCRIGAVSLMPADNVDGMRADTLAVLKELDSPIYRWPGGNFVSGYDWKDGVGPRDRRPPRKNPAWTGVEHNDFGLHEFLRFCEILGTEPYIAVNSGLGSVESAADEVQYANGAADTPMGRLRAEHGHPQPWKVTYWGIGNEMYGGWQLGHMPLEEYVKKHNVFAEAMRQVDPAMTLIAVGAVGRWSETMLRACADHMDLISEHFYRREKPGLLAHVRQIPDAVRETADAHRRYRRDIAALEGKDIDIALDEWNYWYGGHVFGELGTRYFLKDALGIAAGLHEMFRQSDIFRMANYAQTVNVIGAIKTTRTAAALETTGLALAMYRRHFGTVPVATTVEGLADVMAAWTADRKALTVGVVNPTTAELKPVLDVKGAALAGTGTCWVLTGPDPMAYNDPGRPPTVAIEEKAVRGITDTLTVPPCSVVLFRLDVK